MSLKKNYYLDSEPKSKKNIPKEATLLGTNNFMTNTKGKIVWKYEEF